MDQRSEIRDKIDLVAFVGEYITLKKAGRNFTAVCPFHSEKSPSFMVSPERQIFHCFGCGKGGDVYTFLMEYERLEFGEALRTLAKRTGVILQNTGFDSTTTSKKEVIYKLNALAMEFYHYILTQHAAGKKALAYLKERQIDDRLLKTFMVGFAPVSGTALTSYLIQKKKYHPIDVTDAGLGFARGRMTVDFFRGRIIFPLIDHRDNVVGFSGRVLSSDQPGGKYINSRDTLAYHKRDHVFGINVTKDAIRKANQAMLVEGEFDVLSCYQYGISNVVAVKGTALTETQVGLLGRFAQKLTICFDGDAAGQEAIKRSLPIIEKKGLTTTVVVSPNGKDPDESLKTDEYAFKKALKHDIGMYDYLFSSAVATYDAALPEGKKQIADALLPIISDIENAIVKEHYLRKLSSQIDTSYDSIVRELDRKKKNEVTTAHIVPPKEKLSREEMLESYLIALLLQAESPKDVVEKAVRILSDSLSRERAYQKILHHLLAHFEKTESFDQKAFVSLLPQELVSTYDQCLLFPLPSFSSAEKYILEIEKTATQLRTLYLKQRIKTLADQIKAKEREGKEEELAKLQEQYSEALLLLNSQ